MNNLINALLILLRDNIGLIATTTVSLAGLIVGYKTSKTSNDILMKKSLLEISIQNQHSFNIKKREALITDIKNFNRLLMNPNRNDGDSYNDFIGAYNNLYISVSDESRTKMVEFKTVFDKKIASSQYSSDIAQDKEFLEILNSLNAQFSKDVQKIDFEINSVNAEIIDSLKDTLPTKTK